jgi:SAM-dependent methyltransferase
VVEIGPGTGQATRILADKGVDVLALELGTQLADRARTNLASFPNVTVLTTSFEEWNAGDAIFDAVFACNSFHWIDPAVRFTKAAEVLRPGGHLVVLSTPWAIPPDADRFWWDVQDDWEAVGAERVDPSTKHPDLILDLGPAVRASGVFDQRVGAKISGDVDRPAVWRAHLLVGLRGRMVDLVERHASPGKTPRPAVVSRADDHHL